LRNRSIIRAVFYFLPKKYHENLHNQKRPETLNFFNVNQIKSIWFSYDGLFLMQTYTSIGIGDAVKAIKTPW
jgi:hypothetical protein